MQGQQDNVVHKVAKCEEAPTRQFNSARYSSKKVDADEVVTAGFVVSVTRKANPSALPLGKLATNMEAVIISEQNITLKFIRY